MKACSVALLLALVAFAVTVGNAFTVRNIQRQRHRPSTLSSLHMTILTYQGKKKDFKAGSPLKDACAALGVKPKYSCKAGDCGSCTLTVGGSRMKPCTAKVPPEPKLKSLVEKGLEIK